MKQERSTISETLSTSLISGGSIFLFLYATELILNYWFGKKLHLARFLHYLAAYVAVGAVFGLGVGVIHVLAVRLPKKRVAVKPEPLFVALSVSGLVYFLATVVLNASYLRYSPILSQKSLPLNLGLLCFCTVLLVCFYLWADRAIPPLSVYRAVSVCGSMVVALVIFHVFISGRIEKAELSVPHAAGLTFLFVMIGSLAALADLSIGRLIKGGKQGKDRATFFKRLVFAKIIVVAVVLALVLFLSRYRPLVDEGSGPRSAHPASDKPNIIILVLDTVRQDRLSAYGCERETSPNIAELAKQSWVFDAYSTSPWTLPSHATIVTGLYPTETGSGSDMTFQIDPRNETIAEILRKNGYATAAIISNYAMLGHSSGFAQGFDYYYANSRETELAFPLFASYLFTKFLPNSRVFAFVSCKRAESINEEAIRWIKEKGTRPFFLFINYMDAHTPYAPPRPYNRRWFSEPPAANFPGGDIWMKYQKGLVEGEREIIEAERAYRLGQYDGEIAYLDAQIGLFLEELKRIGTFDDSLIILTSDHGEFFFEHGLLIHPGPLYQEVIRVPLIIKPPAGGREKPGRIHGAVTLADLFHSILHYVGISHESGGEDKNLLEGESSPLFSEFHWTRPNDERNAARFGTHLYSLIQGNYKLMYSSKETYEFYDLLKDPCETRNLISEGLSDDARAVLIGMQAELGSRIDRVNTRKLVPGQPSPEEREEILSGLKALGYIQ